jgi:hypothetical protein
MIGKAPLSANSQGSGPGIDCRISCVACRHRHLLGTLGFVTLIGVAAAITTNVSYWIWYGFPADYSLVAVFIELLDYIAAGLAIAWWLGRKSASAVTAAAAA